MTQVEKTAKPNIQSYKDLIVWQKSMDFVENVYALSASFPQEEKYGLTSQIQRTAVSISSNIAEGRSRGTRKDFIQFLHISLGSLSEV
ncbi:MAG: four helix bundle protein [Candidatus Paceibacterota bacterium]